VKKGQERDEPNGLDVTLLGLEIDVDVPQIEPFRMRVDDALEDGLAPLGVSELELKLSELGDRLEVCCTTRITMKRKAEASA
jgi:hypothetical protein